MKEALAQNPADLMGDALRVLKRLAAPGARLVRRGDVYALTGTGRAGRALHVPIGTFDAMRRRDWLSPTSRENGFTLSDIGLGWLRRTVDSEDPFASQHGAKRQTEPTVGESVAAMVTVNEAESPIGRLHCERGADGKPRLTEAQFLAGERMRRDFTLGNLEPRLAVDLSAPVVAGRRGGGHGELTDIAVAARQRFTRALTALGPGLADVAVDVCCYLKEPDLAVNTQGWPDSAALVVLKIALDRLAAHYGFAAKGKGGRMRVWHAPEESDGDAPNAIAAKKISPRSGSLGGLSSSDRGLRGHPGR